MPRMDEVTGEWRKLHNEELNDLYSYSDIMQVNKSRKVRWVGQVAYLEGRRTEYRFSVGRPYERNNLEEPGADGRKLLK